MTAAERIRNTLTELRAGIRRVDQHALEANDWPVVRAFYAKEIARAERRQAKMLAKLKLEAEMTGPVIDGEQPVIDADADDEDEDEDREGGPEGSGEDECVARGESSSNCSHGADDSTATEPET